MRRGFTLMEVVIVSGLCLLLAGLLMPGLCMDRSAARRTQCGNNGRQIAMAMLVYQSDIGEVWPVRLTKSDGTLARSGEPVDDRLTTLATLEFIAKYSEGDLTPKLFACPAATPRAVIPPYNPLVASGGLNDHSTWATAPSNQQPQYAHDWTVPKEAQANRALLACRPLTATSTTHMSRSTTRIPVVYADGHIADLPASGTGTGRRTVALDGRPYLNAHLNRDAANDDIFADDGTPSQPGAGSPTRAWLR